MPSRPLPDNAHIADLLDQIAELLEAQGQNPFRVRAYREAAGMVRGSETPIAEYVRTGDRRGLMALPGIGEGLANVIFQYVREGSSEVLDRLISEVETHPPEKAKPASSGARSAAGIPLTGAEDEPSVAMLLDVDAEYRRKAEAEELPKIAPKRYNPENEAWLPVLRTRRESPEGVPWKFTALFSNTARAHQLEQTRDWVVIYYRSGEERDRAKAKSEPETEEPADTERQVTVVTQHGGSMDGKRVVRGRESEVQAFYQSQKEKQKH